jgi:hypothetical protein
MDYVGGMSLLPCGLFLEGGGFHCFHSFYSAVLRSDTKSTHHLPRYEQCGPLQVYPSKIGEASDGLAGRCKTLTLNDAHILVAVAGKKLHFGSCHWVLRPPVAWYPSHLDEYTCRLWSPEAELPPNPRTYGALEIEIGSGSLGGGV